MRALSILYCNSILSEYYLDVKCVNTDILLVYIELQNKYDCHYVGLQFRLNGKFIGAMYLYKLVSEGQLHPLGFSLCHSSGPIFGYYVIYILTTLQ